MGIRVGEFPQVKFLDEQLLSLSIFFSLQSILTISFSGLVFGSVSLQTVSSCVLSLVLFSLRLSLHHDLICFDSITHSLSIDSISLVLQKFKKKQFAILPTITITT